MNDSASAMIETIINTYFNEIAFFLGLIIFFAFVKGVLEIIKSFRKRFSTKYL